MNISKFCKINNNYITKDNNLTTCIIDNINKPSVNNDNTLSVNNTPSVNNINTLSVNNIPSVNNINTLSANTNYNGTCKYIDNLKNIQSTNIKCNLILNKENYKNDKNDFNNISNLVNINIPTYIDKNNLVTLKPTHELITKLSIDNNKSTNEIIDNLDYYISSIDLGYNSIIYNDDISGYEKKKYIDDFNKLFIIEKIIDPNENNENNENNYISIKFIIIIILFIIIFIILIYNIIKYYNKYN
jgi:hypothetical protein